MTFDPFKAAAELRQQIINEVPNLYAENQRLREALTELVSMGRGSGSLKHCRHSQRFNDMADLAEKALKGGEG